MTDPAGTPSDDTRSTTLKRLGLFKRWYDRYDSWAGRYDWLQWLLSFLKTKAGVAVAGAAAGTATAVGGIAIYNVVTTEPPAPVPLPAPIAAQRLGDSAAFFRIEGKDTENRRGVFDVVVLDKDIRWVRGSATEIERKGERLSADAAKAAVLAPEVKAGLAEAKELIAVGTASQEGDPAEETARAERRARTVAGIISDAAAPTVPVWALNLGQYREACANCESSGTSWQRPVVVIAARKLDDGTKLDEALRDAMAGKPNLPSPSSYSAFGLLRIR